MISIIRPDLPALVDEAAAYVANYGLTMSIAGPKRFAALWIDEASTRNRASTQRAAQELGIGVIDVSPAQGLSVEKGESLEDTFQVLARYADCFAIRSSLIALPFMASVWSQRPILNLGDGWNEHPSQALSTLVALREVGIDPAEARVVCYGDLDRSRTVRSVAFGIAQMGGTAVLVDDHSTSRGREIASAAEALGLPGAVQLAGGIDDAYGDLLYVCRPQVERRSPGHSGPAPLGEEDILRFRLTLHPLPRGQELKPAAWECIRDAAIEHVDRTLKTRAFLIWSMLQRSELPRVPGGPSLESPWTCSEESCMLSNIDNSRHFAVISTHRCPGCHGPIRSVVEHP